MACLILQKQFEYIDGIEDNIVVPSFRMQQIRPQNGLYFVKIALILTTLSF